MTDDIVERLRQIATSRLGDLMWPPPRPVCTEAADEIERLRAEVAELRRHTNCCPYADSEWWCMCAEPHDGDCLYDDEPVAGR